MKIRENAKQIEITKKEFNGCAMLVKRGQLSGWLDEFCREEEGYSSINEVCEDLCNSEIISPLVEYIYSVLYGEEAEKALDFIMGSDLLKNVMREQAAVMEDIARQNFLEEEVITAEDWNEYCNDYNCAESDFIDYDEYMDWVFCDFEKILEYYY